MWDLLKRVVSDCATSANGDYDPARVIGYLIVALGGLEFLVITAVEYVRHDKFDALGFATALAGIGAALAAAAAGVWIKKATEIAPKSAATSKSELS